MVVSQIQSGRAATVRRPTKFIIVAGLTAAIAASWWGVSSFLDYRERIMDNYAIGSRPDLLKAYARDHDGMLPSSIDDLAEYVTPTYLDDLRARIVIDPGLTAAELVARESELRTGAWRPIRVRDPKNVARSECSINDELLSLAQGVVSRERQGPSSGRGAR